MGALSADADESVIQLALLDHRLHRALLDQLDEGVCMVDRDRRILYWNKGAERISGYFSHEVAGQFSHGDLLMHCDSDDRQGPGEATGPAFLRHREGYRLMVELQSRPIQDPDGAVVGALEVFEEAAAPVVHRRQQLESFGCADSSTRAANRKYGEMMVGHALEALQAFEISFGWLRVGLDRAPELDRSYGHAMVEAAVKLIAAALDRNLASLDVLTRWEQAEFRVEVSRCSRAELAAVAERLRLLVSVSTLDWWGDRLGVTVSVGGATAEPGDNIESLEERVGLVYESCHAGGGNRCAIAHLLGSGATGSGAKACSP